MWDKNYTDKETINLFPIPLQATKLNPELKQNPGYTK
nr:RagB/SusD family nutrient uptake outer membrane protein [Bacteroides thetaiotaomicron]